MIKLKKKLFLTAERHHTYHLKSADISHVLVYISVYIARTNCPLNYHVITKKTLRKRWKCSLRLALFVLALTSNLIILLYFYFYLLYSMKDVKKQKCFLSLVLNFLILKVF